MVARSEISASIRAKETKRKGREPRAAKERNQKERMAKQKEKAVAKVTRQKVARRAVPRAPRARVVPMVVLIGMTDL